MNSTIARLLALLLLLSSSLHAQGVREHVRSGMKGASAPVKKDQAEDVTLTLNQVAVRPIQTWVRSAGKIDASKKKVIVVVRGPQASYVKVGQRVRAFSPESKNSMFQAWVTKFTPQADGAAVEVTLSGVGHPNSTNYVVEIVTERGEFLSIPNEAIIEEGEKHIVYVERSGGQYAPVEVETGIQGELYTAVQKGLVDGDKVVSFGSFFVDSEYKLKFAVQSTPGNDQQHH
jgi:hypothetical protein